MLWGVYWEMVASPVSPFPPSSSVVPVMCGGCGDCIVGLPSLTLDPCHGSRELGGLILRDNPGLAWLALAALASMPAGGSSCFHLYLWLSLGVQGTRLGPSLPGIGFYSTSFGGGGEVLLS